MFLPTQSPTRKLRRTAPWVVWGLLVVGGCRSLDTVSQEEHVWPQLEMTELGQMLNVHRCGSVWFGGMPGKSDLDLALRRGILVVVDASSDMEGAEYDMGEMCDLFGLTIIDLEVGDGELTDLQVDNFLSHVKELGESELLLFCGNGSRSSALVAIQRVVDDQVPLDTAIREARRAGMKPGQPEHFVTQQVQRIVSEREGLADSDSDGESGVVGESGLEELQLDRS